MVVFYPVKEGELQLDGTNEYLYVRQEHGFDDFPPSHDVPSRSLDDCDDEYVSDDEYIVEADMGHCCKCQRQQNRRTERGKAYRECRSEMSCPRGSQQNRINTKPEDYLFPREPTPRKNGKRYFRRVHILHPKESKQTRHNNKRMESPVRRKPAPAVPTAFSYLSDDSDDKMMEEQNHGSRYSTGREDEHPPIKGWGESHVSFNERWRKKRSGLKNEFSSRQFNADSEEMEEFLAMVRHTNRELSNPFFEDWEDLHELRNDGRDQPRGQQYNWVRGRRQSSRQRGSHPRARSQNPEREGRHRRIQRRNSFPPRRKPAEKKKRRGLLGKIRGNLLCKKVKSDDFFASSNFDRRDDREYHLRLEGGLFDRSPPPTHSDEMYKDSYDEESSCSFEDCRQRHHRRSLSNPHAYDRPQLQPGRMSRNYAPEARDDDWDPNPLRSESQVLARDKDWDPLQSRSSSPVKQLDRKSSSSIALFESSRDPPTPLHDNPDHHNVHSNMNPSIANHYYGTQPRVVTKVDERMTSSVANHYYGKQPIVVPKVEERMTPSIANHYYGTRPRVVPKVEERKAKWVVPKVEERMTPSIANHYYGTRPRVVPKVEERMTPSIADHYYGTRPRVVPKVEEGKAKSDSWSLW